MPQTSPINWTTISLTIFILINAVSSINIINNNITSNISYNNISNNNWIW